LLFGPDFAAGVCADAAVAAIIAAQTTMIVRFIVSPPKGL
jgi:hypothetical protein